MQGNGWTIGDVLHLPRTKHTQRSSYCLAVSRHKVAAYDILTVNSAINRHDKCGRDIHVICICCQVIRNFNEHKYWPVIDMTNCMEESAAPQLEWWSTLGVLQYICSGVQENLLPPSWFVQVNAGMMWWTKMCRSYLMFCGNSTNHRLGKGRRKLEVFPSQRLWDLQLNPICHVEMEAVPPSRNSKT